jgi:uncharacterized sodium:solute symporter family permease YidK
MYAMAVVMQTVLGWNMTFSIWVGAVTVAIYVMLGGLRSAIINEVLQFVLIWAGAALIPILGLIEAGGWSNLKLQIAHNMGSGEYTHLWSTLGSFKGNPMGVHWTGIVFGLGAIVSFGYWTTDFLVVQRVLSANNLRAAKMAPVIGAAFKMAVPLIVIVPGLLALGLTHNGVPIYHLVPGDVALKTGQHAYDQVLPLMLIRYCGPGLLGLGITALVAGFMSGMAGNVSAFSTVWTYDIYGAYINKKASDKHYVRLPRGPRRFDYGLCTGAVQLLHCAAFRHSHSGHAVEAGDEGWRLLGSAGGNGCVDLDVHLHQHRHGPTQGPRPVAYRIVTRRAANGRKPLSRAVELVVLRAGYGCGELHDQAQDRRGT